MRIPIERDERGAYLTVGLDRADELREALSGAGVAFAEEGDENCGCGGPVLAVFRLEQDPEGKHFLLGERS